MTYEIYEQETGKWDLEKANNKGRATSHGVNKTDAISRATDLIRKNGGEGTIILHYQNGEKEVRSIK